MRSFDKKRRALFKNHYIFGTAKNVSGTDSVEIKSGSGTPLKSLEIKGQTEQKIELDQFKRYAEYFKNLDNYIDSGTTSIWVIPFPNEWLGKELTFALTEKTKMTDITFDVSDGIGLFAKSETLLDSSGNVQTVMSSAYSYFRFTGILVDNLQKISEFWDNYEVMVNVLLVDFPEPVKSVNDEGMSISFRGYNLINNEQISIPDSVEVDGKTVDLRMAHIPNILNDYRGKIATDYLKVDSLQNKVEYVQEIGCARYDNNSDFIYTSLRPNVFLSPFKLENTNNFANSGCFSKYQCYLGVGGLIGATSGYGFTLDGRYYGFALSSLSVKDIRFDNVADFKASLIDNPIEVLYQLAEPIVYDLTETDFGRKLLSLCPPRTEASVFKVDGGLVGIPIKLEYYSREEADTVNITIKYVDENGNEIKEPRVNKSRKGSKYLIIAPHIDGYQRVSTQVYGVADEDTEIELLYRK